ncbi:GNAT family N-acetyltransferase [Pseudomonas sp.]|uniref:GNAT family N-acetyltransferase n=1 Tax=Pseudomonas sp. TaxID=306 RepID=UPI003D10D867
MNEHDDYTLLLDTPSVETYRMLRRETGLSPKTEEAASRGLPASLFAVQVLYQGCPVGMGRVIGDGGCFYQVTDIAVLPAHQGKGLAKRIMQAIREYLDEHAPESAYVSLMADGEAHHLYAQFGFAPTAPASIGMAYRATGGKAAQ